jgi:hypothetical protein
MLLPIRISAAAIVGQRVSYRVGVFYPGRLRSGIRYVLGAGAAVRSKRLHSENCAYP